MKRGYLSEFFVGVGAKTLKGTEVDREVSRGHELQGIRDFKEFLGSPDSKQILEVAYIWMDDENAPLRLDLAGTWYDSRKGQAHREPEYRLYYPAAAEEIIYKAKAGDTLFLCLPKNGKLTAIFCPSGSSIERQLLWLFDLKLSEGHEITQRDLRRETGREIDFSARYILEAFEIEFALTEDQSLEKLLRKFGARFPTTREFSKFARDEISEADPVANPDKTILHWIEQEERLFFTLEKHLVSERIKAGFTTAADVDVDGFISYSLSVQNRRKARAGFSLENHLEAIFEANGIKYSRGTITESGNRPDFLFPGSVEYQDQHFPDDRLTMLGAKSTCKDRWRQVLSEATRISTKHLFTLEPAISAGQTSEMQSKNLQLVIPFGLHHTYQDSQKAWLLKLSDFIELVREREKPA